MTDNQTDEASASAVRLWCHGCREYVPVRPSRVVRAKNRATVHHVTPDAWQAHRATHTERLGKDQTT